MSYDVEAEAAKLRCELLLGAAEAAKIAFALVAARRAAFEEAERVCLARARMHFANSIVDDPTAHAFARAESEEADECADAIHALANGGAR